MPVYTYLCTCGLRFEASASIKDYQKPKACPSCKDNASRCTPTDIDGVFHQEVTGPVPQNTGISQLDVSIDRAIGQSANQGWEAIDERNKDKEQVLRDTGAKRHHLSKNPDGSYRVLEPQARDIHARANLIHSLAMRRLHPPATKEE
jgi:putative FmdB family regulatory protein